MIFPSRLRVVGKYQLGIAQVARDSPLVVCGCVARLGSNTASAWLGENRVVHDDELGGLVLDRNVRGQDNDRACLDTFFFQCRAVYKPVDFPHPQFSQRRSRHELAQSFMVSNMVLAREFAAVLPRFAQHLLVVCGEPGFYRLQSIRLGPAPNPSRR